MTNFIICMTCAIVSFSIVYLYIDTVHLRKKWREALDLCKEINELNKVLANQNKRLIDKVKKFQDGEGWKIDA